MGYVTSVTLIREDRSSSHDSSGNRSYTLAFLVQVSDRTVGQAVALHDIGVPSVGQPYVVVIDGVMSEFDMAATLKTKEAALYGDEQSWKVTCHYDSQPADKGSGSSTDGKADQNEEGKADKAENKASTPVDSRPWSIGTSTHKSQTVMYRDFNYDDDDFPDGYPVKNSANDWFENPTMRDVIHPVIQVSCSKSIWHLSKKLQFEGKVNSLPFTIQGYSFPKNSLLLSAYNAKSAKDGSGNSYYWDISLEFEFAPEKEGHGTLLMDCGMRELKQIDGGAWVHKKIRDSDGQPCMGQLDGLGKKLDQTGEIFAKYLTFWKYERVDFGTGLI